MRGWIRKRIPKTVVGSPWTNGTQKKVVTLPSHNHTPNPNLRPNPCSHPYFNVKGEVYSIQSKGCGVRNPIAKIELATSAMQSVDFGSLQVGVTASRQVRLINRSRRTTTFQLKDPAGAGKGRLEEVGVTFAPTQPVKLIPKESATVELKFRPSSRLPPFNEACNIEVAGSVHKLLTVSGAAQGSEEKVDAAEEKTVCFHYVCLC